MGTKPADLRPNPLEPALEAADGAEDVGELAPVAVARSVLRVLGQGRNVAREGAGLAAELVKVAAGRSEVAPERGDWRFADPTWNDNPVYRRVEQAYLAGSKALLDLVERADLDWRNRERARFALTLLTSAASPTNTLPGNPAAVKRAFETAGGSLVRGVRNWAHDVRHNGGMPSKVDQTAFRVGENLATTPGAVVHRDDVCEVIQYQPSTPKVHARPILFIPPQINKYYFLDLRPGRSLLEFAVSRGLQVFILSWHNPTPDARGPGGVPRGEGRWDLDTYVRTCLSAADVVTDVGRSDDLNLFGLCAGGITTAAMLGRMAATGDGRANSISFGVTLLDFDVPALVGMFASPRLVARARQRSERAGFLSGRDLDRVFSWMRPNDLVWNYWVNNYLMGNPPPAFDILAWNSDSTRLPSALHRDFLDIFMDNSLTRPAHLEVLGTGVDLGKVDAEAYVTGGLTDHLTPWKGCYRTTQLLGGPSTFVLANSGHIQTLVNPPGNRKAKYWTGPEPGPDPEAWQAEAAEHPGTWWEHWADWVTARSGPERAAPSRLGSRRFPAGDPAPGRYVHEK